MYTLVFYMGLIGVYPIPNHPEQYKTLMECEIAAGEIENLAVVRGHYLHGWPNMRGVFGTGCTGGPINTGPLDKDPCAGRMMDNGFGGCRIP